MKNYYRLIKRYVFKHPFLWSLGLIIPPLFTLISRLLIAWLNQDVIKKLGVDGMKIQSILLVIGSTLLGVVIAEFLVYLFNCAFSRFSILSEREMKQDMYEKIFRARIDKLQSYNTGDIITRYNKDIKSTVTFIGKNISGFFYPLVIGIGYCIALIATNQFIGLVTTSIVIAVTLLNMIFVTKFRKIENQKLKSSAEYMQTIDSALQGRITIRMLGLEDKLGNDINTASDMLVNNQGRYISLALKKTFTSNFLTLVCSTLIFPFACLLVAMDTINLPNAIFIASLCGSLMGYTGSLANSMIAMGNDLVSVKRIKEIMDIETEDVEQNKKRRRLPEIDYGHLIKLNKVSIRYGDTEVLSQVDMFADKGEIIVITGPSGCGKSSLFKAILRLIPYDGEIYINNNNIKDLSFDAIRGKIAYVPEKNELIDGDIVSNIKMGKVNANNDQVLKAMKTASLHEFFEGKKIKYCPVGEHGSQLSGGQRQRVAIARAFLKDADILLMDEPTSSLDPVSETKILGQLRDMAKRGKTIIMISHRISTIESADRIFIVNKYELIADATLEEASKLIIQKDNIKKALEYKK